MANKNEKHGMLADRSKSNLVSTTCSCIDCDTVHCLVKRKNECECNQCFISKADGSLECYQNVLIAPTNNLKETIMVKKSVATKPESNASATKIKVSYTKLTLHVDNGEPNLELQNIFRKNSLREDEYNKLKSKLDKTGVTTEKVITKKYSRVSKPTADEKFQLDHQNVKTFSKLSKHSLKSLKLYENPHKMEVDERQCSKNKPILNEHITKLSAQVMNLPYKTKETSMNILFNESDTPAAPPKSSLTAVDVINRIKEMYKACSCNVCECIDTMNSGLREYDRRKDSDPKTPMELNHECTCHQCVCYECVDSIPKPCDCELCKCIVCKHGDISDFGILGKSQSLRPPTHTIAAPVENHRGCGCNPCVCFECSLYGAVATSLTHERSRGVNIHPNCVCEMCINENCNDNELDVCKCERHSLVTKKPFPRDSKNYDIHYFVTGKVPLINYNIVANVERIAPALPTVIKYDKTYAGHHAYARSSVSHYLEIRKLSNKIACDCEVCSRGVITRRESLKACGCDTCDCIDCDGLLQSSVENTTNRLADLAANDRERELCECFDCQKLVSDYENKYVSHMHVQSAKEHKYGNVRAHDESNTKIDSMCGMASSDLNISNVMVEGSNSCDMESVRKDTAQYNIENDLLGYEVSSDYLTREDNISYKRNSYIACDTSNLFLTPSPIIYVESDNLSESLTTFKHPVISSSSCNSSGRDYSDYIIKFPKADESSLDNYLDYRYVENKPYKTFDIDDHCVSKYVQNSKDEKNSHTPIALKRRCRSKESYVVECNSNVFKTSNKCFYQKEVGNIIDMRIRQIVASSVNNYCDVCGRIENKVEMRNVEVQTLITLQQLIDVSYPIETYHNIGMKIGSHVCEVGSNRLSVETSHWSPEYFHCEGDIFSQNINNKGESNESDIMNSVKEFDLLNVNSEMIRKALIYARAFSNELKDILKRYEKANRDFDNIFKNNLTSGDCSQIHITPNALNFIPEINHKYNIDMRRLLEINNYVNLNKLCVNKTIDTEINKYERTSEQRSKKIAHSFSKNVIKIASSSSSPIFEPRCTDIGIADENMKCTNIINFGNENFAENCNVNEETENTGVHKTDYINLHKKERYLDNLIALEGRNEINDARSVENPSALIESVDGIFLCGVHNTETEHSVEEIKTYDEQKSRKNICIETKNTSKKTEALKQQQCSEKSSIVVVSFPFHVGLGYSGVNKLNINNEDTMNNEVEKIDTSRQDIDEPMKLRDSEDHSKLNDSVTTTNDNLCLGEKHAVFETVEQINNKYETQVNRNKTSVNCDGVVNCDKKSDVKIIERHIILEPDQDVYAVKHNREEEDDRNQAHRKLEAMEETRKKVAEEKLKIEREISESISQISAEKHIIDEERIVRNNIRNLTGGKGASTLGQKNSHTGVFNTSNQSLIELKEAHLAYLKREQNIAAADNKMNADLNNALCLLDALCDRKTIMAAIPKFTKQEKKEDISKYDKIEEEQEVDYPKNAPPPEQQQLFVTNKNFALNLPEMKQQSAIAFEMEIDVKDTIRRMTTENLQDFNFKNVFVPSSHKALAKTQTEVKMEKEMPQLETGNPNASTTKASKAKLDLVYIDKNDSTRSPSIGESKNILLNQLSTKEEVKKMQSTKKVTFEFVRKVSEHSIFVKWNPPPDINDIQGYELLLDGRILQKIHNPTRCVAVVSCLPHTDKILLTVRTLLLDSTDRMFFPSTTIVYKRKGAPPKDMFLKNKHTRPMKY